MQGNEIYALFFFFSKNPILYTLYLVKVVGFIDKYNLYYTGPIDTSAVTEGVTLFKY